MDCETGTDIPFTPSDIRNSRSVNSSLLVVDITVTALCGIGAILASICVIFERYWVSKDYNKAAEAAHTNFYDSAEYYHAKLLMRCGILASFCAFVVGLLRILMPKAKNSRRCRILQFGSLVTAFVSILASVAAWADYLRHDDLAKSAGFERQNFAMWPLTPNAWSANGSFRIGEIRRAAKSLFETHAHHSPTILLGWAYWFSVASVLFLFFANLLYLMRKDCKTDQHNQSFVPNRRTGYF
ncbi:hypothetical protein T265_09001 [Opisthorchis viverrini]|uniref:Uncharacterized protein n=1 Tax=Opisthorchis viverrini TaxID=6198 RepID=A0A074Z7D7_OPIVI|nr:hypothetical protein T265_09001 [Opisthorchis viverrini]KER23018.1 hypothetical protein T265_09001 [Opisthorchis viverrini]